MDKKIIFTRIILLLIIGFISYSHIFSNPFVVDDDEFIVKWEAIRDFKNFPSFLKGLTPFGHEGVYRPVRTIAYAMAYKIFGVNPFGYHLFSILVHLSCVILVYLIIFKLIKSEIISFVSAIFFAIHPVHVESITYMASSFDMTGVLFAFSAFYAYIKYLEEKRKWFYILSILFAVTGFFAYEITLAVPFLLILHKTCFKVNKRIRIYIPYFAGVLFYIIVRFSFIGIGGKGGHILGNPYYTILMMPRAFLEYIFAAILPVNLTMDHMLYPGVYSMLYTGYDKSVMSSFSFYDSRVITPVIILAVIIWTGIEFFKKKPVISFCIGWFFISLISVTNIIPTGIIMAEKYLYLASFGYCLLLGYLFAELYNNKRTRYISVIIFCSLALFYFKATVIRNLDWKNPLFLWDDEVKRFPMNTIANNNLGYAYMKIGKLNEALVYLEKAKGLAPYDLQARENLEVCYIRSGRYNEAINECNEILNIAPRGYDFYKIYVNMSAAYNGKGMFDEAIKCSKKALELKPDCREAYNNLISAYIGKNDYDTAKKYYDDALSKGLVLESNLSKLK